MGTRDMKNGWFCVIASYWFKRFFRFPWAASSGLLLSFHCNHSKYDFINYGFISTCLFSFSWFFIYPLKYFLYYTFLQKEHTQHIAIPSPFHWVTELSLINSTIVTVQFNCSVVSSSLWSHGLQQARLLFTTNSWSLLILMSIKLVMPSNHIILCHPLLLLSLIFPSIRVFSNESVLYIRWPKYWSFSFSISPRNEYSGLISFRIDWLDPLAVQETLKSLL